MKYYDRVSELNLLKTIQKKSFDEFSKMTVLKGRRRIGKTTLGILSMEGTDTVYLFVSRKPEAYLCAEYAESIRQSLNEYVPQGITRFKDIFTILMNIGKNRHFNLFIDEFQEFLYINPTILIGSSVVKKQWAATISKTDKKPMKDVFQVYLD